MCVCVCVCTDRKTSRTALLFLRSFLSTAFLASFLSRGSQRVCVCVCVCVAHTTATYTSVHAYQHRHDIGHSSKTKCVCVCVCVCVCAWVVTPMASEGEGRVTSCAFCDRTLGAATYPSVMMAMSVRRHTKVLAIGEG